MANLQQNLLTSPLQPTQSNAPQQSIEQQALNTGNKQNVSNFMTALNNTGAGSNNNFMNSPQQVAGSVPNLVNPNITNQPVNSNQPQTNMQQGTNAGPITNPNQPQQSLQNSMNQGGTNGAGGIPIQQLQMQLPAGINQSQYMTSVGATPASGYSTGTPANGLVPTTTANTGNIHLNQPQTAQPNNIQQNTNYQGQPLNPYTVVSDENLKTNISTANPDINHFLSTIKAHNYTYKDPNQDGQGVFTSPMAQELESTKLGKQAVINTPRGKMVDYARLGGVNLAASSVLYKEQEKMKLQLQQLQSKLNKRK